MKQKGIIFVFIFVFVTKIGLAKTTGPVALLTQILVHHF